MSTTAKRGRGLAAVAACVLLAGQGCGGGTAGPDAADGAAQRQGLASCDARPDDCNSGQRRDGGTLALGLTGQPQLTSTGQQTVVYKLRAQARWSDGAPISAADYEYTWRLRAAATQGCAGPDLAGYGRIASVTGSDNGKTVTVAFSSPTPDWRGLFAALLPAHVAAATGDLSTAEGLLASCSAWTVRPEWTGGPYLVTAFDPDHQVELVANPSWYGAQTPTLEKLVFRFFPDRAAAVAALERGEVDGVDLQPDRETVTRARALTGAGIDAEIVASREWTHLDLNTTGRFLADRALRDALLTAIGSQEIVEKVVRDYFPTAEPRRAHQLFPGQAGYRDVLWQVAPEQGSGDAGTARKALTAAGYTVVNGQLTTPTGEAVGALRLRFDAADPILAATAALIRDQVAPIGLGVTVEPATDLAAVLAAGEFDLVLGTATDGAALGRTIARWRGDSPDNVTGWRSADADALLDRAAVELDDARRRSLLNRQDEIMTTAAVVLPLFQLPHLLAVSGAVVNIRANAAGGLLTSGAGEWGVLAAC